MSATVAESWDALDARRRLVHERQRVLVQASLLRVPGKHAEIWNERTRCLRPASR